MKLNDRIYPVVSSHSDNTIAFLASVFHLPPTTVVETLRLYEVDANAVMQVVSAIQQQCTQQQEQRFFNYPRK